MLNSIMIALMLAITPTSTDFCKTYPTLCSADGLNRTNSYKTTSTGAVMPAWYNEDLTALARNSQAQEPSPVPDNSVIVWKLVGGTLPPGLSLSADGKITGMPTMAGRWLIKVNATTETGVYDEKDFTIIINPLFTITTTEIPNPVLGSPFSFSFTSDLKKELN